MQTNTDIRTGLLSDLRILDMSTMIAAPLTASLLADYGADVIKLERPGSGDHLRKFGAQKEGDGLYWKTLSRNKRSIAVDLHFDESKELIREIVKDVDILIENFRPGTLEKWGLDPLALQQINPQLIVLRVTAYGQDGPYRDRPGFGTLAEAMAGLASVSGYEDREPLLPAYPLADILAGHLGSTAILAAVHRRAISGHGECIDLAIYEAALKLIDLNIVEYDQNGTEHRRLGNRMASTAPRGAYLCRDGKWIALSGSAQSVAERILRTVGGDELVDDPRFRSNADRVIHADELDALIGDWCSQRDRSDAIDELSQAGGAVGPLETVATMLNNPQVEARKSIVRVPDDSGATFAMTNVFPRFSHSSTEIRHAGPRIIGSDTHSYLRDELNLADEQVEHLNQIGAIQIV